MNNHMLTFFYDMHFSLNVEVGKNLIDGVCVPGLTPVVIDGIDYSNGLAGCSLPDRLQTESPQDTLVRKKCRDKKADSINYREI